MKLPWTKNGEKSPAAPKLNKLETAMLASLRDEPEKWSCEIAQDNGAQQTVKSTNRTLKEIVVVVSWPVNTAVWEGCRADCGVVQMSAEFANQWHAIALERATAHASELRRKEVERASMKLALLFDAV